MEWKTHKATTNKRNFWVYLRPCKETNIWLWEQRRLRRIIFFCSLFFCAVYELWIWTHRVTKGRLQLNFQRTWKLSQFQFGVVHSEAETWTQTHFYNTDTAAHKSKYTSICLPFNFVRQNFVSFPANVPKWSKSFISPFIQFMWTFSLSELLHENATTPMQID